MNFQSALVEKLSDIVSSIFRIDYSHEDLGLFVVPFPFFFQRASWLWHGQAKLRRIAA